MVLSSLHIYTDYRGSIIDSKVDTFSFRDFENSQMGRFSDMKNNIFKDSKGSTFHKSKKIVRPNEFQDVNRQSQQSQEQPQPRSPSVKDRISQYKTATSTSPQFIPGSPPNKLAQILKNIK